MALPPAAFRPPPSYATGVYGGTGATKHGNRGLRAPGQVLSARVSISATLRFTVRSPSSVNTTFDFFPP